MSLTLTDAGLQPGVHDNIPNAAYHADPAVGSTTLRELLDEDAAGLFEFKRSQPQEPNPVFEFGTALHELVLESETGGVEVLPFTEWRTKEAKEAVAEVRAAGKIPLKPAEWATLQQARDSVMANSWACALLTGHVAEQTLITPDPETGLMLKARPDARTSVIADLKSTRNANPRYMERKGIPEFGYHQSAAHYQDVWHALTGERLEFHLICVEKTAPYRVSVVQVSPEYIEDGRRRNRKALELYAHGLETGQWPTWPATYTAEPPAWLADQTTRLIEGA